MAEHITAQALRHRLEETRKSRHDEEIFHAHEDDAMEAVLRDIAAGNPQPRELAQVIVEHLDMTKNWKRWYA